jgi:hypothetical protein
MIKTPENANELKTAGVPKDTWILEVPPEVCRSEGLMEGTLISLTLKNDSISGVYLKPDREIDDFIGKVVEEESEYFKNRRGFAQK